jgi:hypothetical protein
MACSKNCPYPVQPLNSPLSLFQKNPLHIIPFPAFFRYAPLMVVATSLVAPTPGGEGAGGAQKRLWNSLAHPRALFSLDMLVLRG